MARTGETSAEVVTSVSSSASQALKMIALNDDGLQLNWSEFSVMTTSLETTVQDSSNPVHVTTEDLRDISISLETTPDLQTASQGNRLLPLLPRLIITAQFILNLHALMLFELSWLCSAPLSCLFHRLRLRQINMLVVSVAMFSVAWFPHM